MICSNFLTFLCLVQSARTIPIAFDSETHQKTVTRDNLTFQNGNTTEEIKPRIGYVDRVQHQDQKAETLFQGRQSDFIGRDRIDGYFRLEPAVLDGELADVVEAKYSTAPTDNNGFSAEVYGDPHFMIQSGEERICFDQYGLDGDDLVLLFDPTSGLKITGTLYQTKRNTIVFDSFTIKTPKGNELKIGRSGYSVESGKINSKFSDLTLAETPNDEKTILKIHKNGKRLIALTVTKRRHLTIQFDSIGSLSNKVRGSVGRFFNDKFVITKHTIPTGDDVGLFKMNNVVFSMGTVKTGYRKGCWFIQQAQLKKVLNSR